MPEPAWFRSLYWRIAIGFVVVLAALMVVQGGVLVWVLARSSDEVAGRSTLDLAALVATELSDAWTADDTLNPEAYLQEHYRSHWRPVALVMADGRVFVSQPGMELSPLMREAAMRRLVRRFPGPGFEPGEPGGGPGRFGGPGGPGGRGGPRGLRRPAAFVPVVVRDRSVAMVVVPPNAPLAGIFRQSAPAALSIAGVFVVLGTAVAALLIFRPAHRRLRLLEDTARRFGTGDATVRAPETGGDEITAVARAFNQMADDLNARARQLEAAVDARRQLLADVSHELMTPLTAIRGYLETLAMAELQLDAGTRRRYLDVVREETARLEQLIGDLLDLARLEAGGGALVREEVAVDAIFRRVVERHEREAAEVGVTLSTSIEPIDARVLADAVRLEQALQNLAANALRHAQPGGSVQLRASGSSTGMTLSVRDTGEGIAPEHLSHVFDRFYKADASRGGDGRGSGLGLSIVKAIVERHGGRITVCSKPGVETIFEIVLPSS